jgi:two-component system cell cycle sensor histidine kinase/response regulator CckA
MTSSGSGPAGPTSERPPSGGPGIDPAPSGSRERFRALLEALPIGVYRTTPDGTFLEANAAMARILGYDCPEDLLGTNVFSCYIDPAERERWVKAVTADSTVAGAMLLLRRRDGGRAWVQDTARVVYDGNGRRFFEGIVQDVTAQREAELELERREIQFRALVEHSPDTLARFDRDHRCTYVSPQAARLTGRPAEELVGLTVGEMNLGDLRVAGEEALGSVFAEGIPRTFDAPFQGPRGEAWYHFRLVPERAADGGSVESVMVVVRDVTELKRAEEALVRSEVLHRSLIENAGDLIAIVDGSGRIRFTSPSFARVLGYDAGDLVGEDTFERIHPADHTEVRAALAMVVDGARSTPHQIEYRYRHKDGRWRRIFSTLTNLLDDPSVGGIVVNSHDVTEERTFEEQLRQSQKMEAIGRLAGGVAHDFNNLLTVVDANATFLMEDMSGDDPRRADLEAIRSAAERGASLTRALLAFSRQRVLQPRVVDLDRTVADMDKLLRSLVGEDVDLDLRPEAGGVHVFADPTQLEQVILNLVVNAREAMPGGGMMTLRVSRVVLSAEEAGALDVGAAGRHALLTLSDTGVGMSDEVRQRIFEPFFTTKESGTGLGLATVYGIVRQSGGDVRVDSAPGVGTTFSIYLPEVAVGAESSEVREVHSVSREARRAGTTVLLVEDDAGVRRSVRRMLAALGHRVIEADSGLSALKRFRRRFEPIDLLVTDVVMPGIAGPALAKRLREIRGDLPVLYISGYAPEEILARGARLTRDWFLEKPFTLEELAARVREALADEPTKPKRAVTIPRS